MSAWRLVAPDVDSMDVLSMWVTSQPLCVELSNFQSPERMVAVPASKHQDSHFHQGGVMIELNITLPEMILWTGTRVALGRG